MTRHASATAIRAAARSSHPRRIIFVGLPFDRTQSSCLSIELAPQIVRADGMSSRVSDRILRSRTSRVDGPAAVNGGHAHVDFSVNTRRDPPGDGFGDHEIGSPR